MAIERVVAAVEHAKAPELVDEFGSQFRQDAVRTTAHGKRLIGRDEIASFTGKVLPGAMKDRTPRYEVVRVLFIGPTSPR